MEFETVTVDFPDEDIVFRAEYIRPTAEGARIILAHAHGAPFEKTGGSRFREPFVLHDVIYASDTFAAVVTVAVSRRTVRMEYTYFRTDATGQVHAFTWQCLSNAEKRIVAHSWLECAKVRKLARPHKQIEAYL